MCAVRNARDDKNDKIFIFNFLFIFYYFRFIFDIFSVFIQYYFYNLFLHVLYFDEFFHITEIYVSSYFLFLILLLLLYVRSTKSSTLCSKIKIKHRSSPNLLLLHNIDRGPLINQISSYYHHCFTVYKSILFTTSLVTHDITFFVFCSI